MCSREETSERAEHNSKRGKNEYVLNSSLIHSTDIKVLVILKHAAVMIKEDITGH